MTPRYQSITNFRWDVVPVPYKEQKYQAEPDLLHRLDDGGEDEVSR